MDIRDVARQAAHEAQAEHSSSGSKHETINAVADAVAVKVLREALLKIDNCRTGDESRCLRALLAAFTPAEPPQQETKVLRAPTTAAETVADPRDDDRG